LLVALYLLFVCLSTVPIVAVVGVVDVLVCCLLFVVCCLLFVVCLVPFVCLLWHCMLLSIFDCVVPFDC